MAAAAVALVGAVVVVVGVVAGSDWWQVGLGLVSIACLVSVAAQFTMPTRRSPRR